MRDDQTYTVELTNTHGISGDCTFSLYLDQMTNQWYAQAPGLGCSRNHAYWIHAVRELCDAHCLKQGAVR